jgi:elongation factor 2
LKIKIERLDEKSIRFFQSNDIKSFKPLAVVKEILKNQTGLTREEIETYCSIDDNQNILFINGFEELDQKLKNLLIEVIEKIQLNGPLCGEKLTEIKVTVEELEINTQDEELLFTDLSSMFYDAFKKALIEAELILMEPIYHTIIQLPPNYIKNSLSLLSKYSAKIKNINQDKDYQATIEILIPVRNSIRFAEDIRSTTSGKAFWQNEFYAFMEVPSNEAKGIIDDIKFHKGLSW